MLTYFRSKTERGGGCEVGGDHKGVTGRVTGSYRLSQGGDGITVPCADHSPVVAPLAPHTQSNFGKLKIFHAKFKKRLVDVQSSI